MNTDKASARYLVTLVLGGDIRLRKGRTHKFPEVEFHSPFRR